MSEDTPPYIDTGADTPPIEDIQPIVVLNDINDERTSIKRKIMDNESATSNTIYKYNYIPPPVITSVCSELSQNKIKAFLDASKRTGIDYNDSLEKRNDFNNPSMLDQVCKLYSLKQYDSNLNPLIFNPFMEECDYSISLEVEAKEMRIKKVKERERIQFVSGRQ